MKMTRCKGTTLLGKRCSRHQIAELCRQHSGVVKITFDFSQFPTPGKAYDTKMRTFRNALKKLVKDYRIDWDSASPQYVLASPITGLTPCETPQSGVFRHEAADEVRDRAFSMPSITKRSRLVIPRTAYSHLRCLVQDGSFEDFRSVMMLTQEMVSLSPLRHRVFTEGWEVGWLHVKIRPNTQLAHHCI